ncbi:MAG: TonB-dependent receptor [Cytophagia bacterium]|nr:MAG: TonB-dependent receptor [Runella sp.]TAG21514.1 MAG: TonB-dependent receptor [Cytophagales bacterium]TAG40799.1 MAG: TonB-dependent receptor [Cytophagia bacterium]TAG82278.1 MAG: TonB-dependent receptor [Cytophagales bacterium]
MNLKKLIFFLTLFALHFTLYSLKAQRVNGRIHERIEKTDKPLVGVNIYWLGTNLATTTDSTGQFSIARPVKSNKLVVSYIGYKTDTIKMTNQDNLDITMKPEGSLQEVVVRGTSSVIDRLNPIQTEIITTKALAKAACCNLSESFETNASVSVSLSDGVTGAKQIQFLGLGGQYVQTNVENVPTVRGLATTFGLNYIPGTWIQSIDIGKGAGSVINGYESMTGAINVELVKPDSREKLYFNAYVNNFGRGEVNFNVNKKLNDRWATGVLSHASTLQSRIDNNADNFLDLPLYTQYNLVNRWQYKTDKIMAQFGIKALHENRLGGQTNFRENMRGTPQAYGFGNRTNRIEFFSKTAKLYQQKPYKGLGFILNGTAHNSDSYFGFANYDARQRTLYANLIYQSIISNTNHKFTTGLSYLLDNYNETYKDQILKRNESVPGAFFEYTYSHLEKFTLVAGLRADAHNLFGAFVTPRLHARWQPFENTTLRLSAGRGQRTPNALAENYGFLVSGRTVRFFDALRPEVSWNYGASLTQTFHFLEKHWDLILDYYRTDFQNQLVADTDHATPLASHLYFYNLQGKSYSNSFQAELSGLLSKRTEVKLAYRIVDVWQTMGQPVNDVRLMPRMMIPRDRVLFNIGYTLPYDKWKADLTVQWNGQGRINDPNVSLQATLDRQSMPILWSQPYTNINAQVSRAFRKFEVYLGGENLLNFKQPNPIINAQDPFGKYFDAGQVWGPIVGTMVYAGIRVKVKD